MQLRYNLNNVRIPWDVYTDRLKEFRDKPVIKALAVIRRCGKSPLLDMLQGASHLRGRP